MKERTARLIVIGLPIPFGQKRPVEIGVYS